MPGCFTNLFNKLFHRGTCGPSKHVSGTSKNDAVGPRVLHDGTVGTSAGVDVVFIHGLRGSRVHTWSDGEYFWPKDFLSEDLDNARIITWGYDVNIANHFSYASRESIRGHAETLLHDLYRIRRLITRPIIFVCHSLGGLVCKEALIIAAAYDKHQRHSNLAATYPNTRGVIFLGTPHRGSGAVALGQVLSRIAFFHRPNTQLLQSLQVDSHTLERQREEFITISASLSIVCVREEIPTSIGIIVSEESASYDGFDVRRGAIPADHINMVKFKSKGHIGYERLRLEKLNLFRYAIMQKYVHKSSGGLVARERDQKRTYAHTDRLIALSCGASIWLCGTGLSTIGLAMQDQSHNTLLRNWQDLVAGPVQQSSSTALAGSIALCSVGYVTACMVAYHRDPNFVAVTTAVCVVAVFVEGLWNGLNVSLMERLAVVMPLAINIGVTLALNRQRTPMSRSVRIVDDNA
ncbi:hypothetical protein BM1_00879 [Bipolaris maydis]|nr:hypothetical protein BM1_00879 [Bipolaris maydis]